MGFDGFYVFFCVLVCCILLWHASIRVCMFLILSPTDYQSILAELQSPAALHSTPHFLEPELPVTPNPSLPQHQHLHYPKPDSSLQTYSNPQLTAWSPEVEACSKEPESSPKSPPRPCDLALPVPTFDFPDPLPSKVRKPHIALNDQLLLSEEEERSFQEMQPTLKPRSQSFPTMCELDVEMAFSTSSPSLSSMSSITPSSPDRTCFGVQMVNTLDAAQDDVGQKGCQMEVKEEIEKVVAAQLAERSGLVQKLVEQELIKNVERKCEMVAKDRSQLEEEKTKLVEQKWSTEQAKSHVNVQHDGVQDGNKTGAYKEEKARDEQNFLTENINLIKTEHKGLKEVVFQPPAAGDKVQVKEKLEEVDLELCYKEEAPEHQPVSEISPQAWVEALEQLQPSESGSNEEEQQRGREMPEEGSLLEEVIKEGSEEKKEQDTEVIESRHQKSFEEVEHAEKNICSLSGWHSDSSSVNVEPPTPGRSVSSDLLDRQERYKCNPI